MKVYRQWNSGVDWSMKQLHARVASVHHGCCACSLHAPPPWSRYTSSPESPLVVSARWQASECDLLENTFLHWHWPTSRLHSSTRPKPQTKCILISSVQLPQLDNGFCRRTCLNNSPIILFNHWKYNTIQNSFSFSNIWALLYNRNVGETPLTCVWGDLLSPMWQKTSVQYIQTCNRGLHTFAVCLLREIQSCR